LKKYIINTLKFIAFLSLGLVLLWFAFRGVNLKSFLNCFNDINFSWIILSFVFSFAAFWLRAIRWRLLIEPLGYKPSLVDTYHAVSMAYLANFAFPRIGEVTRCAVLNRTDKVPFDVLIGTVITERIADLAMLLICIIAVFIFKFNLFGAFLTENIFHPIVDKIAHAFSSLWIFGLIALGLMVAFVSLVFFFKHRIKKIAMVQKIRALAKGVVNGIFSVFQMRRKTEFIFYSILIWACYWIMTWLPVYSIPATSHLNIMDGLFLLVIGGLAITAPVQGGIGVFHAMVSFAVMTLYGITKEDSLAFAVILHESQSIFYILLGGISFFMLFLKRKKEVSQQT
jgi:glycosyltransferase 2 family protein